MRITRVYTRTGDKGTTGLVGGKRIDKDHARIEAVGTVDELNAIVGLVRTFNDRAAPASARLDELLERVQNELFDVGADLATPASDRWEGMHRVGDAEVTRLEARIDEFNGELEPLVEFILPGGGPVGAFLHQGRTVCRRAERDLVRLSRVEPEVGDGTLRYLNRLSDLLFVLARWAAKQHGEREYSWEKPALRQP